MLPRAINILVASAQPSGPVRQLWGQPPCVATRYVRICHFVTLQPRTCMTLRQLVQALINHHSCRNPIGSGRHLLRANDELKTNLVLITIYVITPYRLQTSGPTALCRWRTRHKVSPMCCIQLHGQVHVPDALTVNARQPCFKGDGFWVVHAGSQLNHLKNFLEHACCPRFGGMSCRIG
jgi:hypothetical protein